MNYEVLVLDLDGTLTNSEKKIIEPTKEALLDIQQKGKIVVLASGRPTPGILPLAHELELEKYGGYVLSFNGAKIINCLHIPMMRSSPESARIPIQNWKPESTVFRSAV